MKKKISLILTLIFAICCIAGCSGGAQPESSASPAVKTPETDDKTPFPAFESVDIDGGAVTSEIFSEKKITIVNFWAVWCGPCIEEMPDLARFARENSEDVQVIGILLDAGTPEKPNTGVFDVAKMIMEQTEADYKVILPTASMDDMLSSMQYIPTTYFVDQNGKILDWPTSGSQEYEFWQTTVDKFLNG